MRTLKIILFILFILCCIVGCFFPALLALPIFDAIIAIVLIGTFILHWFG